MKFRTLYDHDKMPGLVSPTETRTQQQFAEDANINTIMERAQRGQMPPIMRQLPMFGDFTGVKDFRSAVEAVREAEEAFMALTPQVRNRFKNDPAELIAFLEDANNKKEAQELGLVEKGPETVPEPPKKGEKGESTQ